MRLLHAERLKFEEFQDNGDLPLYAILSHTWEKDEVTFQDMTQRSALQMQGLAGYKKIRKTCALALQHGFNYVWIDTCCIDKTNSAELSEAINSMYRWYQLATVCYAYLEDVTSSDDVEFVNSRWFTRGWTLQELIAPSVVIFFDCAWQEIGTKASRELAISEVTRIPGSILQTGDLELACVAEKMSWASRRKTTRAEDVAYCLMGLFGVNMPMLYGEGRKAFLRLQEEILKVSDDHTIFAWDSLYHSGGGLLALSPAAFVGVPAVRPVDASSSLSGAITVNNKGIHLTLCVWNDYAEAPPSAQLGGANSRQETHLALLPCTMKGDPGRALGIVLQPVSADTEEQYFERAPASPLLIVDVQSDSNPQRYVAKSVCVRRERSLAYVDMAPSPLTTAVGKGHEAAVRLLLDKGTRSDPDALIRATALQDEQIVRLLLEKGADPNAKDKFLQTPLRVAAGMGYTAVMRLLLEAGAHPDFVGGSGSTALDRAANGGRDAVVELLLERATDSAEAQLRIEAYTFLRRARQ